MDKLRIRGILGTIIFTFAMFCFAMAASNIFATIAFAWLAGSNITYMIIAYRYMERHGIQNMQEASEEHQNNANQLFLYCLIQWPLMWLRKEENK